MRYRLLRGFIRGLAPTLVLALLPVASFAGIAVGVSISVPPPVLPVYVQPAPPGPDYLWTPGYWAYGDEGYYWVPGTWAMAPQPGFLWTPGYWGWSGGSYLWHGGYWGPHVGFYGGVNYGFGYGGVGFGGGYWRGGHVVYNRSVTNVTNINVRNVYNRAVVVNNVNRVSFNGGHGGINARPNGAQLAAEHDHHFEATAEQRQHMEMAAGNRDLRASVNNGRPRIAATERPGAFSGRGVVAAHSGGGPAHGERLAAANAANHGPQRTDRPPQAQHEAAQHAVVARNDAAHGGPANHSAMHAGPSRQLGGQPGGHPGGSNEPHNAPHQAAPHPQAEHRAPGPGGHEPAHPAGAHPAGDHPEGHGPEHEGHH